MTLDICLKSIMFFKPNPLFLSHQMLKYSTALNPKQLVKPLKGSLKLVTPKLSKDHIQSIRKVTGLHLGSTGISWALLDIENSDHYHLLDWNHFPFPTNTQKLHIYDLCKLIFEVQQNLPPTDIHVIESLNTGNRSNTNPVQQVYLELMCQLQSMLCVALSRPCIDPTGSERPSLVFLKNRLTARIFRLLIKSECITSRSVVENIINSQPLSDTEYYEDQQALTNEETRTQPSGETFSNGEIRTQPSENSEDSMNSGTFPNESGSYRSSLKVATETHEAIDEWDFLNFHTRVVMSERFVSVYDGTKGYESESLSIALLNGICFSDLIVRPRVSVVKRLH